MGKASFFVRNARIFTQTAFAVLTNGYFAGFVKGKIYTSNTKAVCVPGLNCYSCPGALFSCPVGALQSVLSDRSFHFSLYVIGFLFVVGSLLGRFVCGFLCPFGLIEGYFCIKSPFPLVEKACTSRG